jgi:hypothetical protein
MPDQPKPDPARAKPAPNPPENRGQWPDVAPQQNPGPLPPDWREKFENRRN